MKIARYSDEKELFELNYLAKLMNLSKGNIALATKLSKIPRVTIYRMVDKYNFDLKLLRGKNR